MKTIQAGDYVIVQRQKYTMLHRMKEHSSVKLGQDCVQLDNALSEPYFSIFQMVPQSSRGRNYTLKRVQEASTVMDLQIEKSGTDNRNIPINADSQMLSIDEITRLRDEALSSTDIVQTLIANSKTFSSKTEFSQEKYLKKKEKKYFEYLTIRKPTVRLLADIFFRKPAGKTPGIRLDDLSQILSYANVHSSSKVLLYDSGSSGLLSAAVMNTIGAETSGCLIHVHPNLSCDKQALAALQLPAEQLQRYINVNVQSVLRKFYHREEDEESNAAEDESKGEEINADESKAEAETCEKKRKLTDDPNEKPAKIMKKPQWHFKNIEACKILDQKVDSMIIAAREHPANILDELIKFLDVGRPVVLYSESREQLVGLYFHLKTKSVTSLRLFSTMMRDYQVLPDRTHPMVRMSSGGYILTGIKVSRTQ